MDEEPTEKFSERNWAHDRRNAGQMLQTLSYKNKW